MATRKQLRLPLLRSPLPLVLGQSFTVPVLAIPATAAVAGARLAGTHPVTGRDMAIATAVGLDTIADAVEELTAGTADSHVVMARHYKGDTAYWLAIQMLKTLFNLTVSNPNWPSNAGLQAAAIAAATSVDLFQWHRPAAVCRRNLEDVRVVGLRRLLYRERCIVKDSCKWSYRRKHPFFINNGYGITG